MTRVIYAAYLFLTLWASLVPASGEATMGDFDKLAHFATYAGMGILSCLAFHSRPARIFSLVFGAALGAALELAQGWVPGRSPSMMDAAANALGIIAGAGFYAKYGRFLKGVWPVS
ncbi:membrane hypothetical protein [Candidatus Desulfarcum epimagneticum]|uniref:VanZ-like domain-containing protein n=1 Tax=uncultured Desulfobacteraceae bacterium TaxID=218296 RepID=A0A484HLN0_9BACT|nr:membrane hypothetical protein [uncultured Desulfobacteraceae bacterium]